VAELACASTRRHLLERREELEPAPARHGIRIRLDVLEDRKRTLWESSGLAERDLAPVSSKPHRALAALERRT
jgi:hypothetical protein